MPNRKQRRKTRRSQALTPPFRDYGEIQPNSATFPGDRETRQTEVTVERLRVPKSIANQIYWIRQTVVKSQITSTATVITEQDLNFTLNDLDGVSNLSAIFDQYCIHTVIVRYIPGANAATAGSVNVSRLYTAIDYDDSTAVGLAGIRQYDNLLVSSSTVQQERILHPRIAVSAYSSTFGAFANQRSWVDCASSGVNHYGIKAILDVASSSTSTTSIVPECEYIVAFRGVR